MHEIANDCRITELEATVAQLEQEKLALQQQLDERDEASRLRLQAVFDRSPVGLVVCDLAGRFVQANPAFQTLVGCSEAERVALEQTIRDQLAALQQADHYKDEFLSVVSHELRTPLNFITGFASLVQDGAFGPVSDGQRQAMERILAGADRMLGLVDNLLDVAKLSSGKLTPVKAATDYTALVEEAANALYPLCESKRLKVALDLEAGLEATIDATLIDRVLLNLLSNAVKFTPEGGHVTVKAAAASGRIRTEVIDTGCGIAAVDMPRLFQRFGQLDMSPTRHHGGTGLGLAITKALIEMHGGLIGVESEPGAGSTFWFELPVA